MSNLLSAARLKDVAQHVTPSLSIGAYEF